MDAKTFLKIGVEGNGWSQKNVNEHQVVNTISQVLVDAVGQNNSEEKGTCPYGTEEKNLKLFLKNLEFLKGLTLISTKRYIASF